MRILWAAAVLLASGGSAIAQGSVTMIVPNESSCGTWIDDRRAGRAVPLLFWAEGFLSGAAYEMRYGNPLEGLDSGAIAGWLDVRCRKFPLEPLLESVQEFIHERVLPPLPPLLPQPDK